MVTGRCLKILASSASGRVLGIEHSYIQGVSERSEKKIMLIKRTTKIVNIII